MTHAVQALQAAVEEGRLATESVAVDLSNLRAAVDQGTMDAEQLKQAVAKLIIDLDSVKGSTAEAAVRMGELATQVQVAGMASVVEEMQAGQADVSASLKALKVGTGCLMGQVVIPWLVS